MLTQFGRASRAWRCSPLVLGIALFAGCSGASDSDLAESDSEGFTTGPGIPNADRPASELFTKVSPVMSNRHMNQPAVVNRSLVLAGNGVHEIWNISSPSSPRKMSEMVSPFHDGEAEAHQVSYARFADGSLHF